LRLTPPYFFAIVSGENRDIVGKLRGYGFDKPSNDDILLRVNNSDTIGDRACSFGCFGISDILVYENDVLLLGGTHGLVSGAAR